MACGRSEVKGPEEVDLQLRWIIYLWNRPGIRLRRLQQTQQKRQNMKMIKSLGMAIVLTSAAAGLTGCAGDRYQQSTGEHIDDSATTSRVKSALGKDTVYKYPDVKVSTFKGTVQLSGFVNQRAQKDRAGDLAKNVPGAKDVVNNITVKE